jgi:NhaP-type Na+/H+ or K+/H+ antiporter
VEVLQPLTVFCLAYLSYLAADVVGWSGIIALIGMYSTFYMYTVKSGNFVTFFAQNIFFHKIM